MLMSGIGQRDNTTIDWSSLVAAVENLRIAVAEVCRFISTASSVLEKVVGVNLPNRLKGTPLKLSRACGQLQAVLQEVQVSRSFSIENVRNAVNRAMIFVRLANGDFNEHLQNEWHSIANVRGALNEVLGLLSDASNNLMVVSMNVVDLGIITHQVLDDPSGNRFQQDTDEEVSTEDEGQQDTEEEVSTEDEGQQDTDEGPPPETRLQTLERALAEELALLVVRLEGRNLEAVLVAELKRADDVGVFRALNQQFINAPLIGEALKAAKTEEEVLELRHGSMQTSWDAEQVLEALNLWLPPSLQPFRRELLDPVDTNLFLVCFLDWVKGRFPLLISDFFPPEVNGRPTREPRAGFDDLIHEGLIGLVIGLSRREPGRRRRQAFQEGADYVQL